MQQIRIKTKKFSSIFVILVDSVRWRDENGTILTRVAVTIVDHFRLASQSSVAQRTVALESYQTVQANAAVQARIPKAQQFFQRGRKSKFYESKVLCVLLPVTWIRMNFVACVSWYARSSHISHLIWNQSVNYSVMWLQCANFSWREIQKLCHEWHKPWGNENYWEISAHFDVFVFCTWNCLGKCVCKTQISHGAKFKNCATCGTNLGGMKTIGKSLLILLFSCSARETA